MRHRPRFVVLDLDGTTLDSRKELTEGVRRAIGRTVEAGLTVVLCTGRMVRSAAQFWNDLRLRTPVIGYNGAMVKDLATGNIFFHCPLDLATTLEVAAFGREMDLNFQAYVNDEMLVERESDGVIEYSRRYGVPYRIVGSFRESLREGSTKLLATCPESRVSGVLAGLRGRFGARVMLTDTEGMHVEVCHASVNKAKAVQFVVEQLEGRREEVVSIGDGPNDVEMLQWAGLGVAMGNAPERVKQAADVVIGSNDEDGLARFLTALIEFEGSTESERART